MDAILEQARTIYEGEIVRPDPCHPALPAFLTLVTI